jgi:hypothetical protein
MGPRSSTNLTPSLFSCPALPHLFHYRRSTFLYLAMGKRGYHEWTPTEESKTIHPRTAESLRSKLRQLRQNIRRRRPVRRRQARIAQVMTAKQARKEQQRTREAPPLATTRVPAHRTHTKFRGIGAGPEQV